MLPACGSDTSTKTRPKERWPALYRREKRSWGGVDNIIKSSSLHPGALDALLRFYRRVMHGECETSLAQREMIAVTVSVLNNCHY